MLSAISPLRARVGRTFYRAIGPRLLAPMSIVLLAVVVGGFLLSAGAVLAKPKLGVECSVADTVKGSSCVKKIENDLMNNVPNPHFLACLADGTVACCKKSTIGPGYNCTYVRVGGPGGVRAPLGNATNAPVSSSSQPGVFGGIGVLHRAQ